MESEVERTNEDVKKHNITNLLSSPNRDYLVRNNGDQVKVDHIKGKTVGLYFSASWCGPCQEFTPKLVEVYNELLQINKFEIVFVSGDEDDEAFAAYFSKMPWLAIPFSDSGTRKLLEDVFTVTGIPHLVILDENGKVLTDEAVDLIEEHGAEAYPFTTEQIEKLEKQEEVVEEKEAGEKGWICDGEEFSA